MIAQVAQHKNNRIWQSGRDSGRCTDLLRRQPHTGGATLWWVGKNYAVLIVLMLQVRNCQTSW